MQHYRKNQYEEALFRAEDDHFELDMIIDQNSSAIRTLQVEWVCGKGLRAGHDRPPEELFTRSCMWIVAACGLAAGSVCLYGWKNAGPWQQLASALNRPYHCPPSPPVQPLAAQLEAMVEDERSSWQLPEKALRAFHYRAVQRIYGEQGAQVVALLRQNPAVAVPTVLNRLTQKDIEWRQVGRQADRECLGVLGGRQAGGWAK